MTLVLVFYIAFRGLRNRDHHSQLLERVHTSDQTVTVYMDLRKLHEWITEGRKARS